MQQINLYQQALRPVKKREPLSALSVISLGLITILALGTLYLMDYEQQELLKQQIAQLKSQERERLRQVDELSKKLAEMEKNEQVKRKIQLLMAERNQKQMVLNRLKDPSIGNVKGFSPHLEGLARQHIPDLWLTGILMEQGGTQMLLDGSTLEAAQVPHYLQLLSAEDAYSGRQFRTFLLQRPEEEEDSWRLDFSIGTSSELKKKFSE